jgi:hypothetical protein
LIGALLAEQHETWLGGRRYLDMEPYWQWKQAPAEETDVIRSAAYTPRPTGGDFTALFGLDQ